VTLLHLYVAGNTASSRRAQQNILRLREIMKEPHCEVRVIDVLVEPQLAEEAGILATPTLSYEHPLRPRRIVGDLGESKRILEFLGLEAKDDGL